MQDFIAHLEARLGRELAAATQRCLQAKLALWHGPKLSDQRRAEILKNCFNEP